MLTKMKDGAIAREIYIHALEYIKKTKPAVEKNFVKNIGYNVIVILISEAFSNLIDFKDRFRASRQHFLIISEMHTSFEK